MLAHLSGIRHYNPGEGERTVRYDSITDALSVFKDDPLKHSPGARYTYSTFGYTLLGAVIEAASGMKFVDYMAQRIFQPAGMLRTQVDAVFLIIPDRARGYSPRVYAVFDGSLRNPVLMDPSYKIPGGGFLSTAEDLARFAIALQEGKLVKAQTFREMATSARTNDGTETRYGYGWYIGRPGRPADRSIWHGGVQAGFTADLLLLPDKRFALVMLTNLEGGGGLRLSQLADQIIKIVLEESPKPSARR